MKEAERKVERWLGAFRLTATRFTKDEMRAGEKTPDFKVMKGNSFQFFCEVKTVSEGTKSAKDTTPNQLTDDIHKAFKQFQSVNPERTSANVMAFVCEKSTAGVDYLDDVLTGHWFMENGNFYPFYAKQSEGRIKHEKAAVDLYLWFEDSETVKFRFPSKGSPHFERLCNLFNIDPARVASVGRA